MASFDRHLKAQTSVQQQRIASPDEKLKRKNEVLSELMVEHVAQKSLGEL